MVAGMTFFMSTRAFYENASLKRKLHELRYKRKSLPNQICLRCVSSHAHSPEGERNVFFAEVHLMEIVMITLAECLQK